MTLHQRTHPTFVEGCGPCRWSTILVSAMATPSRTGAGGVIDAAQTEKRWDKDHGAYRRLRKEGFQPPRANVGAGEVGPAELEQRAEHPDQINTGLIDVKPRAFDVFHEETGRKAMEPA